MQAVILIDNAGQIEMLARDEFAGLLEHGHVSKRRASHVFPSAWLKRQAFWLIRWATGESGWLSDWTRRWRGPWQVQVVNGPHLGEFPERADAIAAEVEWLEAHDLKGGQ